MAIECVKCRQRANIRINVLTYCNACFLNNTAAKAAKLLNGMPHDMPVLVYVDDGPGAVVLCDILQQFFAARRYYTVIACSSGPEAQRRSSFATEHVSLGDLGAGGLGGACASGDVLGKRVRCKMGIPRSVIDFCRANHIKTIVRAEALEDTLVAALESICGGDGDGAVAAACIGSVGGIEIVNPLGSIRDKELVYYLHVKGLARPAVLRPPGKIGAILRDFLHETDSRNSLALFNILGMLKKLG